jgi:SAM-dependent methyltransferase
VLLEDEVPLGPAHAHHYAIRNQGRGRFSHWSNTLFFSASDNTNPNDNGRSYALALPSEREIAFFRRTMLDGAGADPGLTLAVLRAGHNTNGSPLALYANAFGSYRAAMQRAGIDVRNKVMLEIGSGPRLGVALALLLHGAGRVIGNDLGPIGATVPGDYARIIQWLAKVATADATVALDVVTEAAAIDAADLRLRGDRFRALPGTAAEDIDLPDQSVDVIVSTSVLEHVMKPAAVIANTFRLLARGGWCIHSIDLRDHSNPLEPLGFLEKSRAAYVPHGTENRVRASDWLDIFSECGFQIRDLRLDDRQVPVDELGNIDGMAAYLKDRPEDSVRQSLDSIAPWVTDAMRGRFDPEFQSKSLQDLSVLGLTLVAQTPE